MKNKSIISLLICLIMIFSILTPSVIGAKNEDSKKIETHMHSIRMNNAFERSNIHPELLNEIYNNKDCELAILITLKENEFTDNTVKKYGDKIEQYQANVETSLQKVEGKEITHHKLSNIFSTTVKASEIEKLAKIEGIKIYPDFRVRVLLDDSVPTIGANELWSEYDGSGIIIAVIDTGIDSSHPDLKNKIVDQVSFVKDEPSSEDEHGHGTHVAGIIAGSGNASGSKYMGVAPEASLMSIKVLDEYGWGTASSAISGIEYAVDHGADVISLSLGDYIWPPDGTDPLAMAANAAVDAGVVVVAAAGNAGTALYIASPASAEKVIAVGATTKQDDIAIYSSMGPTWDHRIKPEVSAPGGAVFIDDDPAELGIVSVKAFGSLIEMLKPDYIVDQYYIALSGTSMATPHVSGVVALMLQAHPDWTPDKIKQQLMNTAVDLGESPNAQGVGRIDAVSAVKNTLTIEPTHLSYITKPGEYNTETLELSNTGIEDMEVNLFITGGIEGDISSDTISIDPGQTVKLDTTIGIPAGVSTGMHYGSLTINEDSHFFNVPVLMDAPMTFVNGRSRFSDVIEIRSSEEYGLGSSYYYIDIPEDAPGFSTTMICSSVPGWVSMILIDLEGEIVDFDDGWEYETEATVSVLDPMPGKWMILVESYVFDPEIEHVHLTLTTYIHSLIFEPTSWITKSIISAGSDIVQEFTVTNTDNNVKSVQVEGYVNVPDTDASGSFSGSVDYIDYYPEHLGTKVQEDDEYWEPEYGRHTFDISEDASEFVLTMTALNDTAVLVADIIAPNGMYFDWMYFGFEEPSTSSIMIMDPMPGTWEVMVYPVYALHDTTEHYIGVYDVKTRDTSWIENDPEELFVPGMTEKVFTSTLTPPDEANGDYTGELIVSSGEEVVEIPLSVSVGLSIQYPGPFEGEISNKEWRYYSMDVNSQMLEINIKWDNINSDLDMVIYDPSGEVVASSVNSDTVHETVTIQDPEAGTWIAGIYGYNVEDIQQFYGTAN
jgi:serine protease AprX